jgi:protocatechuate 3,4-dioxygenase beta subunit
MRALHSALILLGVAVLVAATWLTLRDVQPAAPALAPAAAPSEVEPPAESAELVAVPGEVARAARSVEAPEGAVRPTSVPAAGERAMLVRGLVLDRSGRPVPDALVLAAAGGGFAVSGVPLDAGGELSFWGGVEQARTDERGRFELRGREPGTLRLAVRAAGFAPWDRDEIPLPAGGDHELAPIELEPSAVLAGRVVDPDGRAIAWAELFLLPDLGATVTLRGAVAGSPVGHSADDGSFTLDQLPAGVARLAARHPEHPDRFETTPNVEPGQRVDGFEIVMQHGFSISGRVAGAPAALHGELVVRAVPESDARELAGTQPSPEARESAVAADGSFSVGGAREGLGYALALVRRRSDPGAVVIGGFRGPSLCAPVSARAGDRGIELVYQPAGALVFQVVDAVTRAPITEFAASAGVQFLIPELDESGARVREHPEGRARITNLRPGSGERVQLEVSAVGYRAEHLTDISMAAGQDTDLGLIALDPVPLVEVTVLDAEGGAPVAGARVALEEVVDEEADERHMRVEVRVEDQDEGFGLGRGSRQTAVTGDDGIARLSSLEGRAAALEVRHADYAPHRGEPFVSPIGAADAHVVRLLRGGSVAVTVETPDGEPLAGARVEHQAPGEESVRFLHGGSGPVTDAAGRVGFAHLAAGTHRFRPAGAGDELAFAAGGGAEIRMSRTGGDVPPDEGWREVAVAEGSSAELLLVAPRRVAVFGTVYEGGEPLEGALVRLSEAGSERDPLLGMLGGGGPQARADGRGRYRIERAAAGEYLLEVTHPSRQMPAQFELRVGSEDVERDVDLPVSILAGRVTDAEGRPLPGVSLTPERAADAERPQAMMIRVMAFASGDGGDEVVSVEDGSMSAVRATTDAEGRYELRGVLPDVDLVVRGDSSAAQPGRSAVVRVGPDQRRDGVDLVLSPAGQIEVLAFSGGKPARNLFVTAVFEGEGEPQRRSGMIENGGRTLLTGLAPGPWRVALRSIAELGPEGGGSIPDQVVDVAVGATASATFDVP